jgi:sialate O-acetylesterase
MADEPHTYGNGEDVNMTHSPVARKAAALLLLMVSVVAMGATPSIDAKPDLLWKPEKLRVANIFASQMVLQRDRKIPVWGTAPAGTAVTVTIDDQKHTTKADGRGWWMVTLDPLKVGEPRTLTVSGMGETIEMTDVLVGEVWLFSGQSNMTWEVKKCDVGEDLEKNPDRFNLPKLRMFKASPQAWMEPTPDCSPEVRWQPSNADVAANMSAIAWTTCERLVNDMDIPIGLVQSECGGSHIQAWMSKENLCGFAQGKQDYDGYFHKLDEKLAKFHERLGEKKDEHEAAVQQRRQERIQAMQDGVDWPSRIDKVSVPGERRPLIDPRRGRSYYTNLYNTMIDPISPFPIGGAVWYQGEYSQRLNTRYGYYLKRMIGEWREKFGSEFPVVVVQLHSGGSNWPLREVQAACSQYIEKCWPVTAADQGNALHTSEKQEVGRRIAGVAMKEVYGQDIPAHGPTFKSMDVKDGKAVVTLTNAEGLRTTDGQPPRGFEVGYYKGSRLKTVAANAKIEGNKLILWNDEVAEPVAVAFGRSSAPIDEMTVINAAGLPLMPFCSDTSWLEDYSGDWAKPAEKE